MNLDLESRTVLVTGSHRGTGLVIARSFLEEGARVFVHGFAEDQAAAAVREIGGGSPVSGDIREDAGADAVVAQIEDGVDILVNNYGAAAAGRWEALTASEWMSQYETNGVRVDVPVRNPQYETTGEQLWRRRCRPLGSPDGVRVGVPVRNHPSTKPTCSPRNA